MVGYRAIVDDVCICRSCFKEGEAANKDGVWVSLRFQGRYLFQSFVKEGVVVCGLRGTFVGR